MYDKKCKDAGIVLLVSVLVFYFDPIEQISIFMGQPRDGGLGLLVMISAIVAITSLAISLRHYWQWVIVTNFAATAMTILNRYIRDGEYYAGFPGNDNMCVWFLRMSVINGLFCLILALPLAKLVKFIRMKWKG